MYSKYYIQHDVENLELNLCINKNYTLHWNFYMKSWFARFFTSFPREKRAQINSVRNSYLSIFKFQNVQILMKITSSVRINFFFKFQSEWIRQNCAVQMERVRENYNFQVQNLRGIREYGSCQVTAVRDQYYEQVKNKSRIFWTM